MTVQYCRPLQTWPAWPLCLEAWSLRAMSVFCVLTVGKAHCTTVKPQVRSPFLVVHSALFYRYLKHWVLAFHVHMCATHRTHAVRADLSYAKCGKVKFADQKGGTIRLVSAPPNRSGWRFETGSHQPVVDLFEPVKPYLYIITDPFLLSY